MKNSRCITVGVGDVVRAYFDHSRETLVGKVTLVTERYGRVNNGRTKSKPLITVIGDSGKVCTFDNGFVVEVLEWAKIRIVRNNIYRGRKYNYLALTGERRGEWFGSLKYLAEKVISNMEIDYPREIDNDRLVELFNKQQPGLVERKQYSFVRVNRKPFKAWVKRNVLRFMQTAKDLDRAWTRLNMSEEADYWAGVPADMAAIDDSSSMSQAEDSGPLDEVERAILRSEEDSEILRNIGLW